MRVFALLELTPPTVFNGSSPNFVSMFLSTIGRISINQIFNLGPQKFSKKFRSLIFMVSRVVCKESHPYIRFFVMYPICVRAYPCQSIPRPEQDPCQSIPRPEQHPCLSNIHAGAIRIPEQPHAGAIPMQEHTITNVGTYPCRIIPRRELYQCLSLPKHTHTIASKI